MQTTFPCFHVVAEITPRGMLMTHSFVLVNHNSNVADTSFLAPLMFLCVGASCVFQLEVQKFIVLSWGLRKSSPRFLNCRIAPS